jgi:hypothetical protein
MNQIIIYSPSYNPNSGGIIVLHKLCHILLDMGYNASLYPIDTNEFIVNDSYKYKITSEIDVKNDIIIYPEIIWGNPLNMSNVVRYIMNVGHITLNRKETWDDNDFWIYFSERFYDGIKDKNILHIFDSKKEYYKNYNLERKYKSCHTFRKNDLVKNNNSYHIHPSDSIEIGFNMGDEYLINLFNNCKKFYSYDTETYLSVLAALCGCESIIVPNDNFTKETLKQKIPVIKYGVKYGIDDNINLDIEIPLLREELTKLEIEPYIIIPSLINKINEHFKTNITNRY